MNTVAKIGFGCYRIDNRIEEHFNALHKAIESGIRIIDTSANYCDGRSEILIGNVLNDLISNGKLKREDVVLITKGGYIQGNNYQFALKKLKNATPFPDVVEFEEGLWHCIHPEFLEDQINRQLHRLDQNENGYIDIYLLHNTEYYLRNARKNAFEKEESQKIYYKRIKEAFVYLEEKVKEGKIKYYGISSNTFPLSDVLFDFTSLEKVYEIAQEINPDNHFKYVQLPFNLLESEAALSKNQCCHTKTVFEFAKENGLKVITNRPLNAITDNGLVRLADFKADVFDKAEFLKYLEVVNTIEDDFLKEVITNLHLEKEEIAFLSNNFVFGRALNNNWEKFGTIEHFNDFVEQHLSFKINDLIDFFDEKIKDDYFMELFDRYIKFVFKLLNMISNYYKGFANVRSGKFHTLINEFVPDDVKTLTLSQKALLLVASAEGVDIVLVGARKEEYVDDVKLLMDMPALKQYDAILSKIRESIINELE
jgi:aryl-alcohol dehydrogenase-like predicted oxidoreductase